MIVQTTPRPGEDERKLHAFCAGRLGGPVRHFRILKKSLDARDKRDIRWVYSIECDTAVRRETPPVFPQVKGKPRVLIVGAGPAGLFCALRLIDHGVSPVLVERGKEVEARAADILEFQHGGTRSRLQRAVRRGRRGGVFRWKTHNADQFALPPRGARALRPLRGARGDPLPEQAAHRQR